MYNRDNHILSRATKYLSRQRKRARWHKIVTALAAIVVFATTYALILPAITMEREVVCEKEEHTHTDECYTEQKVLVCQQEEGEEHTHTDECYQTEQILTCGEEEHTHTDECYAAMKGNPDADVETKSDWEDSISQVNLTGDWSQDILAIAESQLGYTESTKNYVENEAGEIKGYTRYGEWYGEPYGNWDAMFVSFCLNYAKVKDIPLDSDCAQWVENLQLDKYRLYREASDYVPKPGDLVFFSMDESDDTANRKISDHVGIIKEVTDASDPATAKIKTIEGDSDDCVQYVVYDLTDVRITGYGELPENTEITSDTEGETQEEAKAEESAETEEGQGQEDQVKDVDNADSTEENTAENAGKTAEDNATEEQEAALSEEDQARVDAVIAKIDALPSSEEIEEKLTAYEEAGDDEAYEKYYEEVHDRVIQVYVQYEALDTVLQEKVTNREKLMDLEWIWGVMPFAVTNTVNVTAVNSFNWGGYGGALIVHNDNGITVANAGMGETNFTYWYAVRVETENGKFIVKEIYSDGQSKANVYASGTGFILLFHTGVLGSSVNANVGDKVTISSDFWKTTHSYTGTVYGTVTFSADAAQKTEKDNSSKLNIINGASTRDFIELNLYDYGSGSTGKNINDKFNADRKMPGFQQSGGTNNIASLDAFKGTSYMNFGDIVTSDLADGRLVTLTSENPQGINVVKDTANSPISRYSDVMSKTLKDGYPALADGTSLGYLFGAENYSKKMNSQSVDGLFQYDENTGAYSFNSRTNFAQYNQSNDTFTLYDEIFTPNFIMYPFGNFMPFNDIVNDSKQVSQINEDYFEELRLQANYLYQQGEGDQYGQLGKVLGQFMDYAKQDNWGDDWTAKRALEHYFYWGSELPKDDENNFNQISLDRLYSLDYDVASDFYFGMEMKMNFMQPKGGLTGKDGQQPMVFYFTGDDDVWVYLDGELFLDLSGIHRHVGGEIDFVNGEVKYYSLDTMTGDVSTTPYKTVKFSELVDSSLLNEKGTFKDYSSHSFNFYYMERGSGSSVCRMNFNFPLLRKNSISVTKELSVDEQDKLDLLGNPDFKFQVLKEGGNELFIGANTAYDVYDSDNNKIGEGTTDANGVFTLKANQTAVFSNIDENSGKYFVRELLDPDAFAQYGTISVDGTSQTNNYDVTVGEDSFKGVDSPVKDVSNGSTSFTFNNQVTFNKLGSLEITKNLEGSSQDDSEQRFKFKVTLDGTLLPIGTAYTVGDEEKNVSEEGIVELAADETAKISNILAGSTFKVQETEASSKGYTVTYSGEGVTTQDSSASGVIKTNATVAVTVTNIERGTSVTIPGTKNLENPNGNEQTYIFNLQQVTDQNGTTLVDGGITQTATATLTDDAMTASFGFTIPYREKDLDTLPVAFYYKITENTEADDPNILYDNTVYVAEVTVGKGQDGILSATITNLWKDGEAVTEDKTAVFNNKQLYSLEIMKRVESSVEETTAFSFEVALKSGENPLTGDYPYVKTLADRAEEKGTLTFDENGKTTISLKAGENLKINGLPYGAEWKVKETDTKGYLAKYQIGDNGVLTEGSEATGKVESGSDSVKFINVATYELPESGGSGTMWYTISGMVMLVGALMYYIFSRRRRGLKY